MKATAVPYEHDHSGSLVHVDVKKLGRNPLGGGWRSRGKTITNHRSNTDKKTPIGFDYVHSLVDDHSRLTYAEMLPHEKGPTCAAFLCRALDYFAVHGIGRVERLMTDSE